MATSWLVKQAVLLLILSATVHGQHTDEIAFPVHSNLRMGVSKVDITPAITPGMKATGHVREVTGVRDPLKLVVMILNDGETKAAIVTSDLLCAWDSFVLQVREVVEKATGVPAANVMVTTSHNHSGHSVTDEKWLADIVQKTHLSAISALENMREVSIGYEEDAIGFGINRRKVYDGKAVMNLNPDGPNDPRVKVLRFDDGKSLTPRAVLMHAVCHPCFFTWGDKASPPYPRGYPKISADYPGEAQTFVEKCYQDDTVAMFLQGCAGDIRPNLPGFPYRCADEADIQWAGRDLGGAVVRSCAKSMIREQLSKRPVYYPIRVANELIVLPGKDGPVHAELMAMKIGPFLLLSMPGEPMVEYGFKIEAAIADRAIPIIIGYANGNIGYIATAESFAVGGYEPNNCPFGPPGEAILLEAMGRLADRVIGDVFESYSKHPRDAEKREAVERSRLEGIKAKSNYEQIRNNR